MSTLVNREGAMPGPWGSFSSSRDVPRKTTEQQGYHLPAHTATFL